MKLNAKTIKTLKLATVFTAVAVMSGCASTLKNTYGQVEGTVNEGVSDLGCSMRGGDWYGSDRSSWGYGGGTNAKYNSNVSGGGKGKCITNEEQKDAYRVNALKYYARTAQNEIQSQSTLSRVACSAFVQRREHGQTCRGIADAGRMAGKSVLSMSKKEDIKLKTDTYIQASITYRNCLGAEEKSFGKCFVDYANQVSAQPKQKKQQYLTY